MSEKSKAVVEFDRAFEKAIREEYAELLDSKRMALRASGYEADETERAMEELQQDDLSAVVKNLLLARTNIADRVERNARWGK